MSSSCLRGFVCSRGFAIGAPRYVWSVGVVEAVFDDFFKRLLLYQGAFEFSCQPRLLAYQLNDAAVPVLH